MPKLSWPVTRKSSPGGAAPYSAALISLSVPSTPTRSTFTRTPRPPGTSSSDGRRMVVRCIEFGLPGNTATAFIISTDAVCPRVARSACIVTFTRTPCPNGLGAQQRADEGDVAPLDRGDGEPAHQD